MNKEFVEKTVQQGVSEMLKYLTRTTDRLKMKQMAFDHDHEKAKEIIHAPIRRTDGVIRLPVPK